MAATVVASRVTLPLDGFVLKLDWVPLNWKKGHTAACSSQRLPVPPRVRQPGRTHTVMNTAQDSPAAPVVALQSREVNSGRAAAKTWPRSQWMEMADENAEWQTTSRISVGVKRSEDNQTLYVFCILLRHLDSKWVLPRMAFDCTQRRCRQAAILYFDWPGLFRPRHRIGQDRASGS